MVPLEAPDGGLHVAKFPEEEAADIDPPEQDQSYMIAPPVGSYAMHSKLEDPPDVTSEGLATRAVIIGGLLTSIETLEDTVVFVSFASTFTVYVPAVDGAVHVTGLPVVLERCPPLGSSVHLNVIVFPVGVVASQDIVAYDSKLIVLAGETFMDTIASCDAIALMYTTDVVEFPALSVTLTVIA